MSLIGLITCSSVDSGCPLDSGTSVINVLTGASIERSNADKPREQLNFRVLLNLVQLANLYSLKMIS